MKKIFILVFLLGSLLGYSQDTLIHNIICEGVYLNNNEINFPLESKCLDITSLKKDIRIKDFEKYKNLNYLKFLSRKAVVIDTFRFDSIVAFTIEAKKIKGKFTLPNKSKILLIDIYSRKTNDILNQLPDSLQSLKILRIGRVSKKIDFKKISTYTNLRKLVIFSEKLDSIPLIITKLNFLKDLLINLEINKNTISVLKQIKNLEHLQVDYNEKTDYSIINELPKLKKITIYGKVSDSVRYSIKEQLPKIIVDIY